MENFDWMNPFNEKFKALLAEYKPSTKDVEQQKFAEAVVKCVEHLERQLAIDKAKANEPEEILETFFETYRAMFEDVVTKEAIETRIEICGSAPAAVFEVFEELARPLDSAEEKYLRIKANDIRGVGASIAEYILGVRRPLRN